MSKRIHFHFIYLNPEFDQQIADDFWEGKESEDNVKYLWEDELAVNSKDGSLKIKSKTIYVLRIMKGEETISFDIPNMTLIQVDSEEGELIQLGVSSKSVKKSEQKEIDGELHQFFYLKGVEPVSPFNGLYVQPQDFPLFDGDESDVEEE